MIETEIIKKLQGLKEIKPNRNWVSLTKSQILGVEKPTLNPFLIFKPAYAGLVVVFILFGVFELLKVLYLATSYSQSKRLPRKAGQFSFPKLKNLIFS